MKGGESVTSYCARTMGIANKMRFHGEKMEDVAIVEKILRSVGPKILKETKDLGLQLQDRESSSTQSTSTSQSHHEVTAMGGTNSQDHCISSESGQMKPVFLMGHPGLAITDPSQVDISQIMTRIPYPHTDPYFSGLFTAYGQQTIIQPQMLGMAAARVPLPLDVAEDGPIYVNAKQYHGILRRRQTRAKLEAQKKLVKSRRVCTSTHSILLGSWFLFIYLKFAVFPP
ncbi:hypothetical protein F0562_029761 [Nyssa sinensis]|uniref:Nuclear transcription factor Y subunit n=1 Tax=Nyssa sinensis TaxID=561372 RepID=A0A5J5AZ73_9ASTE|nr:hypothetical protein F0562_029761 [Nyssa sinensis]